jgi:hypothetical protein
LAVTKFPTFKSRFLQKLSNRLATRAKALKYHGRLEWTTVQPDEFEWLSLTVHAFVGNYCIVQFVEDNRVSIYIRSSKRRDRGKILLAMEDIKLIDNAPAIVDAVEATITHSKWHRPHGQGYANS